MIVVPFIIPVFLPLGLAFFWVSMSRVLRAWAGFCWTARKPGACSQQPPPPTAAAACTAARLQVRRRYVCASREIKRWDAVTRSPVFASFSAILKVRAGRVGGTMVRGWRAMWHAGPGQGTRSGKHGKPAVRRTTASGSQAWALPRARRPGAGPAHDPRVRRGGPLPHRIPARRVGQRGVVSEAARGGRPLGCG